MSEVQIRDPARDKVSGREGYIHGKWTQEASETKCQLLHLDGDGNRALTWVPVSQLQRMENGDLPPFPNPYLVTDTNPTGTPAN